MLAQVDEERIAAPDRFIQIVVELAVIDEQSERVVAARELRVEGGRHVVEALAELAHAAERGVDAVHRGFQVERGQVGRERLGVGAHAVEAGRELRYVAGQERIELFGRGFQVVGDVGRVVQRARQGRVGREAVEVGQDRVELGQHGRDGGHHLFELAHGPRVDAALDGVARLDNAGRVGPQHERHRDAAHELGRELGPRAGRHAHGVVELDAHQDAAGLVVVVVDAAHRSHGVAVGKDGVRGGEAADVGKLHVVCVGGLEDVHPFQEVDADEEGRNGNNGREGYLDLFGKILHIAVCVIFSLTHGWRRSG